MYVKGQVMSYKVKVIATVWRGIRTDIQTNRIENSEINPYI